MSAENLPKDPAFNEAAPLVITDYVNQSRYVLAESSLKIVTIYEADLDIAEARALRDWLNKVLP